MKEKMIQLILEYPPTYWHSPGVVGTPEQFEQYLRSCDDDAFLSWFKQAVIKENEFWGSF